MIDARIRRHRRFARLRLVAVFTLLGSVAAMHTRSSPAADWRLFDRQRATVVRIDAGDAIIARINGSDVPVHLLGISAPQTGTRSASATDYAVKRLLNKSVILRLEPTQSRDEAGALRAYAFLSDSEDFNLDAVRDGRAYADRREPHTFAAAFEAAEADARKKSRGLWLGLKDDEQPVWRQAWLAQLRTDRAQRTLATRPTIPARN